MGERKVQRAIILAAGTGSRLVANETFPKPLKPVANVALIVRILRTLQAEGIREASATPQLKALRDQFGIPNLPVTDLAQVRKEWDEDSAQWIALATDLGITLD
mgnify:CR=1 FL=1